MSTVLDARAYQVAMASRMVGQYYWAWPGELSVVDGSGFVCQVLLKTASRWPEIYEGGKRSAEELFSYFRKREVGEIRQVSRIKPGALIFYRRMGQECFRVLLHLANAGGSDDSLRKDGMPIALEARPNPAFGSVALGVSPPGLEIQVTSSCVHVPGEEWVALDPFELIEASLAAREEGRAAGEAKDCALSVANRSTSGSGGTSDARAQEGGKASEKTEERAGSASPKTSALLTHKSAAASRPGAVIPSELEPYRFRINLAAAQRYNFSQSKSFWKVEDLPAPFNELFPAGEIFALRVAEFQDKKEMTVDGYLGRRTLPILMG